MGQTQFHRCTGIGEAPGIVTRSHSARGSKTRETDLREGGILYNNDLANVSGRGGSRFTLRLGGLGDKQVQI